MNQRNLAKIELKKINSLNPNAHVQDIEIYNLLLLKPILNDFNSPNYDEVNLAVKSDINISRAMLNNASDDKKNWIHPNGNYSQTRFEKNKQINAENIQNLKLAFTLNTAVLGQIQSSPIVINGVIYISTAFNNIYAFDGKNGSLIWHFKYKNELGDYFPYTCCGPANRGISILNNKLFMGTLDGSLLCINALNGKLIWKKRIVKPGIGYNITAATVVANDKVIIGVGGGDFGIKGFINAHDVNSGELIWTFKAIPDEGQEGKWANKNVFGENLNRDIDKEKADLKAFNINQLGGAGIFTTPAIDLQNNLVIFGTGNAWPEGERELKKRPGDNLYTNSIVAISLDKGLYKWHFQYFPHNPYNFDLASPPVLINYKVGQDIIPAVIQAGKSGNIFIHNRLNGALIKITDSLVPKKMIDRGGVTWSPIAYYPDLNYAYSINKTGLVNDTLKTAGHLVATDLSSGKIAWSYSAPATNGGVLATAGNLVFFGQDNGLISSMNAISGKKLWTYKCDAGANGVPASYEKDGQQYIIIGCGGSSLIKNLRGNKYYSFKLK